MFKNIASKNFTLKLISYGVFINGAIIVYSSLLSHLIVRDNEITITTIFSLSLVIGLSLIYLSTLISRRKYLAWMITLSVYSALFALNIFTLFYPHLLFDLSLIRILRSLIMPGVIVFGLLHYRREFRAKSDIQSFKFSLRFIAIVLSTTLLYGVIGMQILDKRDFHQQISLSQSVRYTINQFGFSSKLYLTAYTGRAKLFLFTLSLVGFVSLIYAIISLFQPLKARFKDQTHQREHMISLLDTYGGSSEDFFKIWPKDKTYIFATGIESGVAFRVEKGVALCVGDPAGKTSAAHKLLDSFEELCLTNDWLPAFVHTEPSWNEFYTQNKYKLQKIGEEAVIDVNIFSSQTGNNKYFRNIKNKFSRNGYQTELLLPPHSDSTLKRLKDISNQWLLLPGREERGFMMGFYDDQYIQSCPVFVAMDKDKQIQCFLNQIDSFNKSEGTYDLLRYANDAPGNINDFLLVNFIAYLNQEGYKSLNLGLAPLAGIEDEKGENSGVIHSALKLLYSQGDRFYSFKGLYRFKQKYEPNWQDRYIAFKGGISGFSRTANALNKAMKHSVKHRY